MRDHRLGELPGTILALVAIIFWLPLAAKLELGSGLICWPTTTSLLALVPGGSQVIRVAVATFSFKPTYRIGQKLSYLAWIPLILQEEIYDQVSAKLYVASLDNSSG